MGRKRLNDDDHSLKERLNPDLVHQLSTKKQQLKNEEKAKQEQEKQRRIKERQRKEANKSFEELLNDSELDWHQFK
ncbi:MULTISPECIES: YqkE family protein [Sediminibacillus]|uniref:YqkE family protein n=1 Tax=Sediminibacillus TaxID=482460 RepID=UPI0004143C50|nr:YqkE family protein [Sediminibacillus terrae]